MKSRGRMVTRSIPALLIGALVCGLVSAVSAAVTLKKQAGEVVVSIDDSPFARFDTGKRQPKPFFHEVRAADGTVLTRPINSPGGDHRHHKGIWLAVDEVNDIGFWAERGQIKNTSVELLEADANPAVMRVENQWLSPEGLLVLREKTTIRIYENRLLDYEIALTAHNQPVTFGDTKEGFFAFRMVDSMRERETGKVVNADGLATADRCWGKTSQWVDYHGQVKGKTYGVAIFDHPRNFRKSRYHVRDYGLFAISPFGEGAYTNGRHPADPITLAADSTLRLRYGIYIHDGDARTGKVSEVYEQFVARDAPDEVQEIGYRSSADGSIRSAMFYAPRADIEVPLMVALHSRSGDYRQTGP